MKHCFNDESGHMLNTRYKDTEEIVPKYMTTYNRLNEVRRANFLNFLIDVAENDPHSWEKHDYYRRIHGVGSMNMLLGDFFGVKITDMNQERAEKNMKRLKKMHDAGISINFNGFSSINKRFRDNRWRVPLLRPGGIHHTLIDSEFPNYPVEVMFRGIKDETLNLYGPHRHDIYTANGKKDNPIYCGRG